MSLQKQKDFLEYLKKEFKSRHLKNPSYSLRAFSNHLDIDSSRLSKILKGQRPISSPLVSSLGARLGLSSAQIEKFKKGTRQPYKKNQVQEISVDDCYQLKMDQLALISEWHHYAIMEIMKHPDFEANSAWISEQLHISEKAVEKAIDRLQRIGLLQISKDGKWKDISEGFSTHSLGYDLTSRAHRAYQAEILNLAKEALYRVPIENRDHSTIVVASNAVKLQEAKRKIKNFRRELAEFLEDCEDKKEVYHLSIGLFPIPKNPMEPEEVS